MWGHPVNFMKAIPGPEQRRQLVKNNGQNIHEKIILCKSKTVHVLVLKRNLHSTRGVIHGYYLKLISSSNKILNTQGITKI